MRNYRSSKEREAIRSAQLLRAPPFNFYQQQAERINHHKSGIDGGDKAESKLNPERGELARRAQRTRDFPEIYIYPERSSDAKLSDYLAIGRAFL
jgi:hypothetical protein